MAFDNTSARNQMRSIVPAGPTDQMGAYVQRLMRLGVPGDVAIRIGVASLQNARKQGAGAGGAPIGMQISAPASAPMNPAMQSEPVAATGQVPGASPQTPSFGVPILSHPGQVQILRPGQPFLTPDGRVKRAV